MHDFAAIVAPLNPVIQKKQIHQHAWSTGKQKSEQLPKQNPTSNFKTLSIDSEKKTAKPK
jgi:hypothetical protein